MATTSTSDSETGSDRVAEAVRNALAPDVDDDCVTVRYEGDEGPFHIQFANFPDGRRFNVCNYGDPSLREHLFGDPGSHTYSQRLETETDLEIEDRGDMFVVLETASDTPELVLSELRDTARICGADLGSEAHVKSQNLRPGGWRGWLLAKVRGGD